MTNKNASKPPSTWIRATTAAAEPWRVQAARRRMTGAWVGALLGFSYSIVAELINRVALPGVPLYQPPLGALGNIMLTTAGGLALGVLTTLPESPSLGIFLGGLASALAMFASLLWQLGSLGRSGAALFGFVLSVPLAWLGVPLIALLRWTADRQVEALGRLEPVWRRIRVPLAMALALVLLALFELNGPMAKTELLHADAMLRAGLRATTAGALPAPLRGPLVQGFPLGRADRFTLEWTQLDLDRFIELRPASSYDQHAAVIARFEGGYLLVCLYPTPKTNPNCGTY